MAGRHVVVTLTPVYLPDTLPFRTLTFADTHDSITVGRASKSEAKQLIPAHNNAWFDNRVISRAHAEIYASFAEKKVLVTDTGSMHGTFVNDEQVSIDDETEIKSGDVLTFGSEVTRWPKDDRPRDPFGGDTFPPLKVRCQCQWFDDSVDNDIAEESSHQTSKNSFSVPEDEDDDDDDVRVIEPVPESQSTKPRVFSPIHFTVPCSEDSEDDSEGEGEEQGLRSSPSTSHSDEIKESVVVSELKESTVKSSVEDRGEGHLTAPIIIQPDNSYGVARPISRLGSQDRPIEVEDSLYAMSDIDGWRDEERNDYSSSVSGDEASDSGSDDEVGRSPLRVVDEVHESAPAVPEQPSQSENKSSEEHKDENHGALPSAAESVAAAPKRPFAEADSEDESEDENSSNASLAGCDSLYGLTSPCFAPANPDLGQDGNANASREPQRSRYPPLESLLANRGNNWPPQTRPLEPPTLPGYDLDGWGMSMDPARRTASPSDKALAKPPDSGSFGLSNTYGFPGATQAQFKPGSRPWRGHDEHHNIITPSSTMAYPMNPFMESMRPPPPQAPAPTPVMGLMNAPVLTREQVPSGNPALPVRDHMSEIMKKRNMMCAERMRMLTEHRPNHRGVAISDIVANADNESNLGGGSGKGVKRKADEMEEEKPQAAAQDERVEPVKTMNDIVQGSIGADDSIPDAQPQNLVEGNGYSASQLTELSATKADEAETQAQDQKQDEDQDQEPPRKKVKMTTEATNASRPRGNFTKYAATALAGAVVGGVGAIATLIALPPDFFA
ncbi:hypothetical protein FQN54_002658 [Arachnomyces sp. PD_36]|nr:hypothetical protein FQN54_002658 [Arachnomyces sp. PD_36]